jgi:hypothetical protein
MDDAIYRIDRALGEEWERTGRRDGGFLLVHSEAEIDAIIPLRSVEATMEGVSFRLGTFQIIADSRVPEGEYYVARRV